jgi:hypothetical protein
VVILQAALDAHRIQATSATTSHNGKLLSRDRPKQP